MKSVENVDLVLHIANHFETATMLAKSAVLAQILHFGDPTWLDCPSFEMGAQFFDNYHSRSILFCFFCGP